MDDRERRLKWLKRDLADVERMLPAVKQVSDAEEYSASVGMKPGRFGRERYADMLRKQARLNEEIEKIEYELEKEADKLKQDELERQRWRENRYPSSPPNTSKRSCLPAFFTIAALVALVVLCISLALAGVL